MNKIKKILIVGYFSSNSKFYTYATSFYKIFQELGYIVDKFDYRQSFLSNCLLKYKANKFNPDLIFFIKAETISYKTIKFLKKNVNSLIVNFYPDNPFCFWNGNSNSDILNSLPFYDYFLIWSKQLIPILEAAGCKNLYYFPFAYDRDLFEQKIYVTKMDEKKYLSDVCFVGTWDKYRENWLAMLCDKLPNLDLKIWGNLWMEKLKKGSILKDKLQGKAIYTTEMIKAFRCSKIVLNFIREQNLNSHNMKTFEIPASKAFLLSQRTNEQTNFLFQEGKNIECFSTVEELINKINFYLKNDNLRNKIINKASQRVKEFNLQLWLKIFMDYLVKE